MNLFMLAFLVCATDEMPKLSPQNVERAAVAARRKIDRCSITWTTDISVRFGEKKNERYIHHLWMNQQKKRLDLTYAVDNQHVWRQLQCTPCGPGGGSFFYLIPNAADQQDSARRNSVMAATLHPVETQAHAFKFPDPRILALMPTYVDGLHDEHFESCLLYPNREEATLQTDTWNGKPCYIVRFVAKTEQRPIFTIWIVPSMDYAVVRITVDKDKNENRVVANMEAQYAQFGQQKLWYPTRCSLDVQVGGQPYRSEVTTVSNVRLNDDFDPNSFEIGQFGLPEGTLIFDYTKRNAPDLIVKNNTVETFVPIHTRELPRPLVQASSTSTWWYLAGTFAGLAVMLCGYGLWRMRASAASGTESKG